MALRYILSVLVIYLSTADWAAATDYKKYRVDFDCFSETPSGPCTSTYSLYADLDTDGMFTLGTWGSGRVGHPNEDPDGSRLQNLSPTNKRILAIYIKIADPSKNERFTVDSASAGHLFSEVWRKPDGTEAIFNGANNNQ